MAREQRLVFGEVADLYDRARPGYPEALVDDVVSYARARRPVIGCSRWDVAPARRPSRFAARELQVTALEPDPSMASIAQRNCVGLDAIVEVTSFEDWTAEPSTTAS